MPEDNLISKEEAAQRLGIKEKTLAKYVRNGDIKAVKNPVNDSIVGIKESEIQRFLNGGVMAEDNSESVSRVSNGAEQNAELVKIKGEVEVEKARVELELAKRQFATFGEFDKALADYKAKIEEVTQREWAIQNDEKSLEEQKYALEERESNLVVSEENVKQQLLSARERISRVDEEHKRNRESQDRDRRERHAKEVSFVDYLADTLYNAPPQSISNRVREMAISYLEALMEGYGMKPEFNQRKEYVRMDMRSGWMGLEIKSTEREKVYFPQNGDMPTNTRKALKICKVIYRGVGQDSDGVGGMFCRSTYGALRKLQSMVSGKSDEEIEALMDNIMAQFGYFNRVVMQAAESYQNSRRNGFSEWSDWLCRQSIKLEKLLDIGVLE